MTKCLIGIIRNQINLSFFESIVVLMDQRGLPKTLSLFQLEQQSFEVLWHAGERIDQLKHHRLFKLSFRMSFTRVKVCGGEP